MKTRWRLRGDAVVFLGSWRSIGALVHYTESPVGPYDETAEIVLTRRGQSVARMSVSSAASRDAGRTLWGFPKVLERLYWQRSGRRIVFESESKTYRAVAATFSMPFRMRGSTVQVLNGRRLRVRFHIVARARLASCESRPALVLEEFEMLIC